MDELTKLKMMLHDCLVEIILNDHNTKENLTMYKNMLKEEIDREDK